LVVNNLVRIENNKELKYGILNRKEGFYMRINTSDLTLKRNYLQKYRFLITEYELVKAQKHRQFKYVKDFYKFHDTDHRSFLKYYSRFKQSGNEIDLLPAKRGPKWKTRRACPEIEQEVKYNREKGMNRLEIAQVMKPKFKERTPSPSGIYCILKRLGINTLKPKMKEEKKKIIKEKAGELGHIDTHYLSKAVITGDNAKRYLVCVIDSCTRIAWAEVVDDIKALTVMFCTLRCFNMINKRYNIEFEEILSDNGPEFGKATSLTKQEHPFERMLMEVGIKHRYIRPYRPQTNGKIERFWRTLKDDLLSETTFDSLDQLNDELFQYLIYYNQYRPHSALEGKTPSEFNNSLPRIT
jgi:transposase InsO family protein